PNEMIGLLEESGLVLPALPKVGDAWDSNSLQGSDGTPDWGGLTPDGSLTKRDQLLAEFPFADSKSEKIVWNLHSHHWRSPLSAVRFELFHFDGPNHPAEYHGKIERVYPRRIHPSLPEQLFRERVSLAFPGTLD